MAPCRSPFLAPILVAAGVVLGMSPAFGQAVDVAGAEALVQKNKCTKCHSVDKKKDGPSFKETAARYKGKADGEAKLARHLSSGPRIKIDGVEEEHQILKATEPEAKNLVRYILSR
jgi:cytochrome c